MIHFGSIKIKANIVEISKAVQYYIVIITVQCHDLSIDMKSFIHVETIKTLEHPNKESSIPIILFHLNKWG